MTSSKRSSPLKKAWHAGGGEPKKTVRYAVVGLGHISQVAVLPAFDHAENSELVALVSDNPDKLRELSRRYQVSRCVGYDQYDELLESGEIDAVYISLPNHLHCDYSVRAANAGVHVLCEKPMAVQESECEQMIRAAEDSNVRLMIAYRLHFESANLEAIELVQRGELGDVRIFSSVFSQTVKEGDIRLMPIDQGGGSVYDMGVYCINAARYLFKDEPTEVMAFSVKGSQPRFEDCDEMTSAVLRFPGNRLAQFVSSFGATDVSSYRVVGTRGELRMDPAYEYATETAYEVFAEGGTRQRCLAKRDQFAPELIHFSDCVLRDERPEPDGYEGWADVRIIRAIYESAQTGRAIAIEPIDKQRRPTLAQAMLKPGIEKPHEIYASGPSER
jgi:predicted dehydrogenase